MYDYWLVETKRDDILSLCKHVWSWLIVLFCYGILSSVCWHFGRKRHICCACMLCIQFVRRANTRTPECFTAGDKYTNNETVLSSVSVAPVTEACSSCSSLRLLVCVFAWVQLLPGLTALGRMAGDSFRTQCRCTDLKFPVTYNHWNEGTWFPLLNVGFQCHFLSAGVCHGLVPGMWGGKRGG